jgi:hypothetical protein
MRIHSSSLTITPARLTHQSATKNRATSPSEPTQVNNTRGNAIPNTAKVEQVSATAPVRDNSANSTEHYQPTDKNTRNALNAYQRFLTQPFQTSDSLLSSVDVYA